jgi:hypothetical protein
MGSFCQRWRIQPLELPRPWRYCASCEDVWKLPLFERRTVDEIGALLEAFVRHDRAAVWKYAFDIARLRPHVIKVDTDVRIAVERTALACDAESPEHFCIHFDVPFPCDIRLDRLLAGELGISRSALERTVSPKHRDALRKRVRDGQVYMLSKNDLTADKQNGGTNVL